MLAVKLLQWQSNKEMELLKQFGLVFASLAQPAASVEQAWSLLEKGGLVKLVCGNDTQKCDALCACLLKAASAILSAKQKSVR